MFEVTRSRTGDGIKYSREEEFKYVMSSDGMENFLRNLICHLLRPDGKSETSTPFSLH